MATFIGVECLAANALIELYEQDINEISFKNLAEYGLMVVEEYENETEEHAVFVFNQEKIQGLVLDYSEYFCVKENGETAYLCLNDGVEIKELKEQFRWTMSYEMLKAIKSINITDIIQA